MYSAQAQSNAAKYNKIVAEQNAVASRDSARVEEQRQRMMAAKHIGQMRANYGATGVSIDSFADVLADSETNAELDALLIRHSGEMRARGYQNGATREGARAKNSRTAGYISAAGELIGGGARAYDLESRLEGGSMKRTG
jgi:hypothetical protein